MVGNTYGTSLVTVQLGDGACATLCTYAIGFPFTSIISTQTTGVHHIWSSLCMFCGGKVPA